MRKLVYENITAGTSTTSFAIAQDWKAKGMKVSEKLIEIVEDLYPKNSKVYKSFQNIIEKR